MNDAFDDQIVAQVIINFFNIRNIGDKLRDKICTFGLLSLSNTQCQRNITMWKINASEQCLSKEDQALVIKNDGARYDFGLKTSMKKK